MHEHDTQAFATGLAARLASRSRHVCLVLGAGAAKACGLPDVAGLEAAVRGSLAEADRSALGQQLAGRNIEQALSRLRRIAGLVSGDQTVDGLTAAGAIALDTKTCHAIVKALSIENCDLKPMRDLAAWLARCDYRLPVELFTVNYDLLIETALEAVGVPYFDGFVGSLQARFRTELVEAVPGLDAYCVPAQFVRLWKLHGSVNWFRDPAHHVVRIGSAVSENLPAAIYPSDAKYEESRRVPFIVLQDRLRRALLTPETLAIVTGYSFGDAHLNEVVFDAATRRERSEFIVFSHAPLTQDLCTRAERTPNLQIIGRTEAVLGGVRAPWAVPDAGAQTLWDAGGLSLPHFAHLAAYLARSGGWAAGPGGAGTGTVGGERGVARDA